LRHLKEYIVSKGRDDEQSINQERFYRGSPDNVDGRFSLWRQRQQEHRD
jgi:hypothetical protein